MQKVIVASTNPAKISAVSSAFSAVFPEQPFEFIGVSVESEVRDQPMTAEETLLGAQNRVRNARAQELDADYVVGLEAGLDGDLTFAWMVIEHRGKIGKARSASLPLPPAVLTQLAQGRELGDVMDEMFQAHNVKQKGGAIGMLTNHLLTRSSVYHQALILALIPFVNEEWF
ncbi:TPA: inosine/xanthosine triphosphatase [Photobacterium damselae]